MYILDEAEEGDDEEDEYKEDEYEEDEYVEVDEDRTSMRKPKVTRMPGPSAKQRLTATFDDMANWFEQNSHSSSQSRQGRTQTAPESRMYLLDVQSRFHLSTVSFHSLITSQELLQNISLTIFGGTNFPLPYQLG
jgi:hypothetical protein